MPLNCLHIVLIDYLITIYSSKTDMNGKAEKPVFAMQIVDYYKGTASGNITLRYLNTYQSHNFR